MLFYIVGTASSFRVLSHLARLPGPNPSSIAPPPPASTGLRSYYFIWVRTTIRLRRQASSCLPHCLVTTTQEKAAKCITLLSALLYSLTDCKSWFQIISTYSARSICCFWHCQSSDPPVHPLNSGHHRDSSSLVWILSHW